MESVIHIFHGFLGSPNDFSFLIRKDVILHDVYNLNSAPKIRPDDILIGYSMGGRIALDLGKKIHFNIKKIVLINAHPGLSTQEDRESRKKFEASILERLKTSSMNEFMSFWNALPIFKFDAPIELRDEDRFTRSANVFDHYRLSMQENHLENVTKIKDKVLWIIGSQDEKYVSLARETLVPMGIFVKYIEGGHRLFQKPEELKKILKEEHIL